jgi:hypothetical protein
MAQRMKKRHKNGSGFDGPTPDVGRATQFKVGNPGGPGRPRTARFSDAARQLLAETDARTGETNAEYLVRHCFRMAKGGSVRHLELLLAYVEGRPKQGVELSGPDGGAMKFENMSEAEIDARLKELLEKYQLEKSNDTGRED